MTPSLQKNASIIEYFTNGRLSATNYPDPVWESSYAGIRRVNIFWSNINVVLADATQKAYWVAEARFIRTLLYFEMVKRYGGISLVGDQVFKFDEDIQLKRNTFEECVNYIVSECDDLKNKLRQEPVVDTDLGRITLGTTMALKSRLLLYAASPLYNDGGLETNPAVKILMGYPSFDAHRWQKAVDAAKELVDLNKYTLELNFIDAFIKRKIRNDPGHTKSQNF
nr:RagB/SusD family nutrient uptake outer membrane protein [Pedobacter sp. ASV2]